MPSATKIVFETPWFAIEETTYSGSDATPYYAISRQNGVVCLVLTNEGDLVFVRQLRAPLGRETLEVPAGGIEPGETPEEAVSREVLEETGCICNTFTYITPLRLMINREDVIEHFFIATDIAQRNYPTEKESLEVVTVTRPELRERMINGTFDQSVALSGIYIAEKMFGFRFFEDSAKHILNCLRENKKAAPK